jgi:hypothetical protein
VDAHRSELLAVDRALLGLRRFLATPRVLACPPSGKLTSTNRFTQTLAKVVAGHHRFR